MTSEPDFGQLNDSVISSDTELYNGDISFTVDGYDGAVIKIKNNGDIFIKGNLVTNDMEVVNAFKEFFLISNNWYDTAAQMSRNSDYYRGLVVKIGKMLGAEAYISDDGSVQDDVLCAKIPELVASRILPKIIIKANGNIVGHIQSLVYKENDGRVCVECSRTIFDIENVDSVFSGGVVVPDCQLVPFTIIIFGVSQVEVIENVWINKIGCTYKTSEIIIVEPMYLKFEKISKF